MLTINLPEGDLIAYLAVPASGSGRGVLVLHAWWGLTDFFKQLCDRLAEDGFTALAPDLYHGAQAHTIEEAKGLLRTLDREQANREVKAAVRFLSSQPAVSSAGLGAIGFSLGAGFACFAAREASKHIQAVVLFYGTAGGRYRKAQASFLGHFAETDPFESAEEVAAMEARLRQSGRKVEFHTYPGAGHWFFENNRPDAYDEPAANLAWKRTVEFLRLEL